MREKVETYLRDGGAEIIRVVDLSGLPEEQTLGMPFGIVFCMVLSREFIREMYDNSVTADEYLRKEAQVESLADSLAAYLQELGWRAHSQSEPNNIRSGFIEFGYIHPDLRQGVSALPQKTLAHMAGIGFLGKNNLLITEAYGCALTLCSVLTDAPLRPDKAAIPLSRCGVCSKCKRICPVGAIRGKPWTPEGGRSSVVDVSKCCCALRCMVHCPWTMRYAGIPD